jgi:hypothetical protein
MHLLHLVIFTAGLRWWWMCRDREAVWWLPLVGLQIVAMLVKEDGVMFAPVIVSAHVLWTLLGPREETGRLPSPPGSFVMTILVATIAVVLWRSAALGGIGGYATPTLATAWQNLWTGFYRAVALQPIDRPGKAIATWLFVAASVLGGLAAASNRDRRPLFLMLLGFSIVVWCDLPFALVTKREQWHLLSLGSSMQASGGLWALWSSTRHRLVRGAVIVAAAVAVVAMAWVSRQMASDFAPYSAITLSTDRIVLGWANVSPEVRTFLERKADLWAHGRRTIAFPGALPLITSGLHGEETGPDGRPFRWTRAHAILFLRPGASRVTLPLAPGLPPQTLSIDVAGGPSRHVVLDESPTPPVVIDLPRSSAGSRRFVRVDLRFDRSFVPSDITPGVADHRQLAARLGPPTVD